MHRLRRLREPRQAHPGGRPHRRRGRRGAADAQPQPPGAVADQQPPRGVQPALPRAPGGGAHPAAARPVAARRGGGRAAARGDHPRRAADRAGLAVQHPGRHPRDQARRTARRGAGLHRIHRRRRGAEDQRPRGLRGRRRHVAALAPGERRGPRGLAGSVGRQLLPLSGKPQSRLSAARAGSVGQPDAPGIQEGRHVRRNERTAGAKTPPEPPAPGAARLGARRGKAGQLGRAVLRPGAGLRDHQGDPRTRRRRHMVRTAGRLGGLHTLLVVLGRRRHPVQPHRPRPSQAPAAAVRDDPDHLDDDDRRAHGAGRRRPAVRRAVPAAAAAAAVVGDRRLRRHAPQPVLHLRAVHRTDAGGHLADVHTAPADRVDGADDRGAVHDLAAAQAPQPHQGGRRAPARALRAGRHPGARHGARGLRGEHPQPVHHLARGGAGELFPAGGRHVVDLLRLHPRRHLAPAENRARPQPGGARAARVRPLRALRLHLRGRGGHPADPRRPAQPGRAAQRGAAVRGNGPVHGRVRLVPLGAAALAVVDTLRRRGSHRADRSRPAQLLGPGADDGTGAAGLRGRGRRVRAAASRGGLSVRRPAPQDRGAGLRGSAAARGRLRDVQGAGR
ncbi:hypothetical protein SCOCK_280052 [Actinacidiphila cocklensis]|uniref:Uncharacterized protein n=1 Tax=Actinacidiphila cocklensis TaxID=887465 RepID=A0A9W4E758_9ACTN|nr:hypothetical protein SCOCK_280052 [Actinacidiphila cocklensis]